MSGWVGRTALLVLGLTAAVPAHAQAPRAAVAVEGADQATRTRMLESATSALAGLGYEIIAPETLAGARAFTVGEDAFTDATAEQLRAALGARVLFVASLRPARGGQSYVAVRRYGGGPPAAQYGQMPTADVSSYLVREVVSMDRGAIGSGPPSAASPALMPAQGPAPVVVVPAVGAPTLAPAVGAPAVSRPAVAAPVEAGPVAAAPVVEAPAAAVGAQLPVDSPATVAPSAAVAPVAAVAPSLEVQPSDTAARSDDATRASTAAAAGEPVASRASAGAPWTTVGLAGVAAFAAGWLLTPLVGGLAICNQCDAHIGFGFVPIAGPWIDIAMTPGSDDGLIGFYATMGILQLLGLAAGAVGFGMSLSGGSTGGSSASSWSVLPFAAASPESMVVGLQGTL